MICKRCHMQMTLNSNAHYWECRSGHRVIEQRKQEDSEQPQRIVSIDIPQVTKPKDNTNRAYKRRVEQKLAQRKKWLSDLCLEETDVIVNDDHTEHVDLPGLNGEIVHHPVPDHLTRYKVFSYGGSIASFKS